jgi:hypothetical protein
MLALPLMIFLWLDDAPGAGFAQAAGRRHRRNCAEIERSCSAVDDLKPDGAQNLNGPFYRLATAMLFSLILTFNATAATVAETVSQWGLIGPWSLDCSLAPDRDKGALLEYVIAPDGRVVHRRDFGDGVDESEVMSAKVSRDGILNLRVQFPKLDQTREYGLILQPDGTLRAMYNRDRKRRYSIKDGRFTANGNPTPPQHRCR